MITILRPVSKLNEYKYKLNDITIAVSGSSKKYIIAANNVSQIIFTHKYTDHIVPIIQVHALVGKDIYKILTASADKISATVALYKYIASGKIAAKDLVFSKTFKVLNEFELQASDTKIYTWDTTNRQSDNNVHNSTNQLVEASFYLIDEARLTNYQAIKSYFLKSASLADIISLMFSDRKFKSILMNAIPGDGVSTRYIPAYNLMASIEYLNNRYGLFNTSYIFYMDIIETYLLDKINLGKAVRKNKPTTVSLFLEKYSSVEATALGSIIHKNAHIINIVTAPSVSTLETYIPYMAGSTIASVDTNNNIVKEKGVVDKTILVFNSKAPKQLRNTIDETKATCLVGVSSIDISAIAPNLLYTLSANADFNNINRVSGSYRLNSSVITLVKDANSDMGLAATLELVPIVK